MTPFLHGMILMTPEAIEARHVHAIRNTIRMEAWALAIAGGATVLEADSMGQRAYWGR